MFTRPGKFQKPRQDTQAEAEAQIWMAALEEGHGGHGGHGHGRFLARKKVEQMWKNHMMLVEDLAWNMWEYDIT